MCLCVVLIQIAYLPKSINNIEEVTFANLAVEEITSEQFIATTSKSTSLEIM